MISIEEIIGRMIDILKCLTVNREPLSVRQIADRTGLSRSTVHRVLTAMERQRVLVQDPRTKSYELGPVSLELGLAALSDLDVKAVAQPFMEQLRDRSGETVGLSLRVEDARVYVEQLVSPHELKAVVNLGERYPLHSGAPGYALLSFLPDEQIDAFLDRVDIVPPTSNAPADVNELRAVLERVRAAGYAIAVAETMPGLSSIAVPLYSRGAPTPEAALSVTGPTDRFDCEAMDAIRPALVRTGTTISRLLGSPSPLLTGEGGQPR